MGRVQSEADEIDDLLAAARSYPELKGKKRGIFYRKSSAFLHFHEDARTLLVCLLIYDSTRFARKRDFEWTCGNCRSSIRNPSSIPQIYLAAAVSIDGIPGYFLAISCSPLLCSRSTAAPIQTILDRSEERRVGKECISLRW